MIELEASTRSRLPRPWHIAILVIAGLFTVVVFAAATRTKIEVRVISPVMEDIDAAVSTTGTVLPAHDFPARANFSGEVEAVYVQLGQKVRAGEMLVRLKDQYAVPRLERAQAGLLEDEVNEQNVLDNGSQEDRIASQAELVREQAEENQAANALKSMQEIAKNGSVTQAELDAAKQRLNIAESNLSSFEKRLTQRYSSNDIQHWKEQVSADKATLAAEKVSWGNANIASPIAGTVYLLPTHVFDFVPAGLDLMHIADLNDLQIRANFEEIDVGLLHLGMPVNVNWDGKPGRTWHGHIVRQPLALSHSGDRRVGECLIALDGDHSDLPVNADVGVQATTAEHKHVLTIPREALHTDGTDHFVYLVKDGRLRRTPVDTGLLNAMRVEITKGISAEDTIALQAISDTRLADGMRVTTTK